MNLGQLGGNVGINDFVVTFHNTAPALDAGVTDYAQVGESSQQRFVGLQDVLHDRLVIGMDAHVQFSVAGQVLQGGFDGAFDSPVVLADLGGDDAPGDGDSQTNNMGLELLQQALFVVGQLGGQVVKQISDARPLR